MSEQNATGWLVLRIAPLREQVEPLLLVLSAGLLAAGVLSWLGDARALADAMWAAGTSLGLLPSVAWMVVALIHGRTGVDLIAALSLVGTLATGEYFAGALITLMLASGRALESAARRRATRDLRALAADAPQFAHRYGDAAVERVHVEAVAPGDHLLVTNGEVVPVDGSVIGDTAVLDESVVTGEAWYVRKVAGEAVLSGTVNVGDAFDMRADATAADSTYSGLVRLTREAGAEQSPAARTADRYATWFLPLVLLLAGVAWQVQGTPVAAVAVLVVATPCPLLLAVPIALVSGLSRSSRTGAVVRDGTALENLALARTVLLDKTGTLTEGSPQVERVVTPRAGEADELLSLAASLEQASSHVMAEPIVAEARHRHLHLVTPDHAIEQPGRGMSGVVRGQRIEVGALALPEQRPEWMRAVERSTRGHESAIAWIAREGALCGAIVLRDQLRADARQAVDRLRRAGVRRIVMLTGDRPEVARAIAQAAGLDEVLSQRTPADKVAAVRTERAREITIMVGDGVNDAPALAAATVGVAMGARGATASSEAADVVLTADRLAPLADCMDIAVRARRIAAQSAITGMSLSLLAMLVAATGALAPPAGAILQEAIDIAVIMNSLRALNGRPVTNPS
ncbi:heavy metal translocating P-type ATPase [Saccharopolyspora gloriosae]